MISLLKALSPIPVNRLIRNIPKETNIRMVYPGLFIIPYLNNSSPPCENPMKDRNNEIPEKQNITVITFFALSNLNIKTSPGH